ESPRSGPVVVSRCAHLPSHASRGSGEGELRAHPSDVADEAQASQFLNSHTSLTRDCWRQFRWASWGNGSKVRSSLPSLSKRGGTGNSLNSPMPFPYRVGVANSPLRRRRASP